MSAVRLDLDDIIQNKDFVKEFEFVNEDSTAFDISDRTYTCVLRRDVDDPDPSATFEIDTDLGPGRLVITLDRTVTVGLAKGVYSWALDESFDDGDPVTLFFGKILVSRVATT